MLKEKAENPTFKDKDLNEIKIYTEQRLRTILEEAKNKKDYFLMRFTNKLKKYLTITNNCNMKLKLNLTILLIFCSYFSFAQTWQWGKTNSKHINE